MENTVKNLLTRMSEKEIQDIYSKLNSEGKGFTGAQARPALSAVTDM